MSRIQKSPLPAVAKLPAPLEVQPKATPKPSQTGPAFEASAATRSPVVSGTELTGILEAVKRAPQFMVPGNMPEQFHLEKGREVDPGSIGTQGTDGRGAPVWVVDQKVTYGASPKDFASTVLGFFTGSALGSKRDGPKTELLAVETKDGWRAADVAATADGKVASNPMTDPSVKQFVARVYDVRPMPQFGALLKPGNFEVVVDKSQVHSSANSVEFTLHFLNPKDAKGPFPGVTDGAVRYRAHREGPGQPTTVEGYYVTRGATEYWDSVSGGVRPLEAAKGVYDLGKKMFEMTPMGWLMKPVTHAAEAVAEKMTDAAVGASGTVFDTVMTAHAHFYRTVLFPNMLGG